ncbi:phage tail tape measure protein [Bosea sp. (in: a-proteobacteria)]|uniref:phage tail tape measure protein n=1 Tax=Bosea sp. (in: a-proteobacteria) TaxID=1871050 RepID=UPI002B46BB3B|nr:phage tail tape measure protein [Bosea sp. (in: a-proteobacteria)]WRH59168.1 MAG: phage tail tape measure protein [Bosea sp. (in: a-proteobacteria)]
MARMTSELVVKLNDQVSGPAGKIAAAMKKATSDLGALKGYKAQTEQLDRLAAAHTAARDKVKALAAALIAADAPSKKMQAAYAAATASVDKLGNKMEWQKARVQAAAQALSSMGVSVNNLAAGENKLRAAIDQTSAAMKRQEAAAARSAARRQALGGLMAGAGIAGAHVAGSVGKKSVVSVAEFDIATRKQREFTDISEAAQNKMLLPQAKKIGQDTQFSNLDIVKAQTKAMQGLPSNITGDLKAEIAQGIIENVKNYALVMEADMEKASEAIRSYLQATGKDISSKEKALFEANKATNQLVKMAKLGGMSDDDVQGYLKFAAASGTAAGLTPESMMSIAALARRGGLRGDEAGTFMRTASSKLVSPTKDGIAALNAAGINHSKYVKMPDKLGVDGLQGQFRNSMGLEFSKATRAKLESVLADKDIIGDRGKFTTAVTEAVEGQMPKTKKGTMRPADRVNVAKSAGTFHKMSAETVDVEALLDNIMQSNMTLAQLNAFFTDKHGGKAAITAKQREEFVAGRAELRKSGDDPDFAKKKADSIMAGVGGSFHQAAGAIDNFVLNIGKANESLIKFGLDGFSGTLDAFGRLSSTTQQVTSVLAGIAALGAGVAGSAKLLGLITGGGAAAALTGSATALDASAAALMRAAVAQGAGGVPDVVKKGAGTAAVAAGIAAGVGAAAVAGAAAIIVQDYKPAGAGVTIDNAKPGQEHDAGQRKRKSVNELYRQRMEEFKKVHGDGSDPTEGSPYIPRIDSSSIDDATTKAGAAKDKLTELNQTVTPNVNLTSLQELVRLTQSALDNLMRLGGAAASAKSSVAGIGAGGAGRGRSDVATATANLTRSQQTNLQDREFS